MLHDQVATGLPSSDKGRSSSALHFLLPTHTDTTATHPSKSCVYVSQAPDTFLEPAYTLKLYLASSSSLFMVSASPARPARQRDVVRQHNVGLRVHCHREAIRSANVYHPVASPPAHFSTLHCAVLDAGRTQDSTKLWLWQL